MSATARLPAAKTIPEAPGGVSPRHGLTAAFPRAAAASLALQTLEKELSNTSPRGKNTCPRPRITCVFVTEIDSHGVYRTTFVPSRLSKTFCLKIV